MIRRFAYPVAALAVLACHQSITGPPSGLPVTFAFVVVPSPAPPPSLVAAGDSVVGSFTSGQSGCYDYHASAGYVLGNLVMTFTETEADRVCIADAALAVPRVRIAAHRARPGRYSAVLRLRRVDLRGSVSEYEQVRTVVALP